MSSDESSTKSAGDNNGGAPSGPERTGTVGGAQSPQAAKPRSTVTPSTTASKNKRKHRSNSGKRNRLNKIRRAALESGLNESGKSFKRSLKARKACHEKMQRKIESDCFALGVLQLEQDTIATILNCKDLLDPKTSEEAVAITKMCLYGNLMIPSKVYALAKDVTLNAKFLFTSMPFTECKQDCLDHALNRDMKYHLLRSLNNVNQPDDTAKGGMSDPSDVVETRTHADKMGFPFNNRAEEILDLPTKDTMTSVIVGQRARTREIHDLGVIALRELKRYFDAFDKCAKIHAGDRKPFVKPQMSERMSDILEKRENTPMIVWSKP